MRVTVNDIAKAAKVSQTTVSRVLNNHPYIKESTRQKVLKAIEELNFSPDSVARSMITGKTKTLGLIVGDISNPYFAESAKIIIGQAKKLGYDVIISNTDHDDDNFEDAIRSLMAKRVDGLLISSVYKGSETIKRLYDSGFPVVLFINRPAEDPCNYVVLDNEKGIRLAVDHLVQLGHRKIAFVSGSFKYSAIHQRFLGFEAALRHHGLEVRSDFVYSGTFDYDHAYHFVDKLLSMKDAPTAFLAASDQIALVVMDAAANKKYKIPEDLSVVGFDNMRIASNQYIGLTTVSQQKEKMAIFALENLVLLIEKGDTVSMPVRVVIEPELIVRKTTGPVKPS